MNSKFNYTQEEFIEKCKKAHEGFPYDYSKTILGEYNKRIPVICTKHGEFTVIPYNFIKLNRCNCPGCVLEGFTTEVNINKRNLPEADIVPWLFCNDKFVPEELYKINRFFINEISIYLSGGLTPWYIPYEPDLFKKEFGQLKNCKQSETNKRIYCHHMMEYFHRHLWFFGDEGKTPVDKWITDREKIIDNRLKYINVEPRSLRRFFKIQYSVPSLFQDSIAKWMASQIEGNLIYDPFAGFGARMLGTISLGKTYVGMDLNKLTVNGNLGIIKELGLENAKIIYGDSSKIERTECDGCITSVPYMNLDPYPGTQVFSNTKDFQGFINSVFKNIIVKDKAIIDFKAVKGCTLDEFEEALPFKNIERKPFAFGGMARNGSGNQSVHTFFICKN